MTEEHDAPPTIAEVLGRTARALRADRKLELVAYAAKSAGLNWGSGRVADLEGGRVSPTVPTLFALCQAFGALLDRPVSLAELFAGDGPVRLTGTHAQFADHGIEPPEILTARLGTQPLLQKVKQSMLEADHRMARSLGLDSDEAAIKMATLWGQSFTAERDRRAAAGANPQKRGRISRELKTELKGALNRGDD
jgi:transcriptional regulator with XRE-family HTH domain